MTFTPLTAFAFAFLLGAAGGAWNITGSTEPQTWGKRINGIIGGGLISLGIMLGAYEHWGNTPGGVFQLLGIGLIASMGGRGLITAIQNLLVDAARAWLRRMGGGGKRDTGWRDNWKYEDTPDYSGRDDDDDDSMSYWPPK